MSIEDELNLSVDLTNRYLPEWWACDCWCHDLANWGHHWGAKCCALPEVKAIDIKQYLAATR